MISTGVKNKIRVALVQQWDAGDVRAWSGCSYFSRLAFERHVGEVVDLSPGPLPRLPLRVVRGALRVATGKRWSYDHDPAIARLYGRHFSKKIREVEADLIFAPAGSACVPFLRTELPIVYFSDTTWRCIEGYYESYSNHFRRTARGGDELERRTIHRASISVFSSQWAVDSAIGDYGADPERVFNFRIGANLANPPRRDEVLPRALSGRVRLLFVGVRWEEKGGPIAVDALRRLLELGYDASLTVLGCTPPRSVQHPRLRTIPFLNKQIAEQREQFERVWREADIFILPTRHECAGAAFCEASAHALPSVGTLTGGSGSIVTEGVNGFLLPPEAPGAAYAERIAELLADPARYEALCRSSRDHFETKLSWDSWGRNVASAIETRLPHLRGRTQAYHSNVQGAR